MSQVCDFLTNVKSRHYNKKLFAKRAEKYPLVSQIALELRARMLDGNDSIIKFPRSTKT